MLLKRQNHRAAPRRGVILMVVLAMLTLFAIVGVAFVLFSDATAMSSRISREAETQIRPDMDPELAMSFFLGQMIYDVHDDATGVQSALRGHSFARNMYGANFTGTGPYTGDNSLPYCGVGRFHNVGALGVDEYTCPNYQYFATDALLKGKVRDPEYTGTRTAAQLTANQANTNPYLAGNASYTYCDGNTMCLAYMDTTTGAIKVPSFHREWMFARLDAYPGNPSGVPVDAKWTSQAGKYMTMRPRMKEHPKFPPPLDRGGDVKNADWAPGGCDSIWIDIGAPVQTMADGRKYKMLVAPLILDLDGRLNLNAVGNILGTANAHRSNQGWGAWEMNPSKVLNADTDPVPPPAQFKNEWQNLFLASPYTNTTNNYGRYGIDQQPNGSALATGTYLHQYGQIDLNAKNDPGQAGAGGATAKYLLAGAAGNPNKSWFGFPYFPPAGYGDGAPTETTPYHPAQYNPLRTSGDDRLFSVQSMHALLRSGGSGSEFVTTDLRVLMYNLALDPTAALSLKRRNQVTTLSMDLDRPSIIPFIWNPSDSTAANRYQMPTTAPAGTPPQPSGGAAGLTFPTLAKYAAGPPSGSEFDKATWRSLFAQLGRVNLNRSLRHYPNLTPNNTTTGVINYSTAAIQNEYLAAVQDRQQLAQDIFNVLQKVTGAVPLINQATGVANFAAKPTKTQLALTSPEYQSLRWLAQLSVNIVDYIDEDDYMTPFQWDTGNTTAGDMGWVFGVEAPRLTLNEAYAQLDNDNSDQRIHITDNAKTKTFKNATLPYRMNLWLELHNPMPTDTPAAPNQTAHEHGNPNAQLELSMTVNKKAGQAIPVYQVLMVPFGPTTTGKQPALFAATGPLSNPANVTGDPDFGNVGPTSRVASAQGGTFNSPTQETLLANPWGTTAAQQTVVASNGAYSGTSTSGFYVLGAQPPVFPIPIAAAPKGASEGAGGVVTIKTTTPHGFTAGEGITISNVGVAGYNGNFTVQNVLSPTSFTYVNSTTGLRTSGGGTAGSAYVNTADNPNLTSTATLASAQLSYAVPLASVPLATSTMPSVDVVLQRLACPHLPPNPLPGKTITTPAGVITNNPALPPNPYITTDMLELTGTAAAKTTQVWDSRRYLPTVPTKADSTNASIETPITTRHSFGRIQPYAASAATGGVVLTGGLAAQNPTAPPALPANQPRNTFFRHNARQGAAPTAAQLAGANQTLKTSFDWLTQLDRILISPMELLNVSGVKPHELTHYFQNGCTQTASKNPSAHLAQWTNGDARLYRAFEFLTTGSLQSGYAVGGRVPGKININTMGPADKEVFHAVVSAQLGNSFYPHPTSTAANDTATDTNVIDPLFTALIQHRTLNASLPVANANYGVPGALSTATVPGDNPYLSLATGHSGGSDLVSTNVRSLSDTLLRPNAAGATWSGVRTLEPSLQVPPQNPVPASQSTASHPYQRYELLNKIYNNLTVRSNVFAVFMTVGFFEVANDQTTPVTLGAEIGHSENRHIRHRMFAIVDRTNLQMASTTLKKAPAGTITIPAAAANANGAATTPSFVVKNITNILTATTGTNAASNLKWTIQAGTMLTVDANMNTEETVPVFAGAGGALQARFFLSHTGGNPVVVRGNPGPWPGYNPRLDTAVVPYFAIID